jgi:hypothetical protein
MATDEPTRGFAEWRASAAETRPRAGRPSVAREGYERHVTEIDALYGRYRDLQRYVSWTEDHAAVLAVLRSALEPGFPALIDDFYEEIDRHEATCGLASSSSADRS